MFSFGKVVATTFHLKSTKTQTIMILLNESKSAAGRWKPLNKINKLQEKEITFSR